MKNNFTQEKINKDNKLIAEFMGFKQSGLLNEYTNPNEIPVNGMTNIYNPDGSDFKYSKSWDWLMPIIEKIESIDAWIFDIYGNKCEVEFGNNFTMDDITFYRQTKIEATYKAVVAFIKWYNNEKSTHDAC